MISFTIGALEHGWADIEMDLNGCTLTCCFEYTPNDAFAELLKSAFNLMTINQTASKVSFPNGTERVVLSVNKSDDINCTLTIRDISTETEIKQYVKAILRMFDKYVFTHTKEDYMREWRHPFPSDMIEKLHKMMKL